ncbi:MAG: hypothetical protein M5T61_21505 [Acidimicrobiia bacterium]|nr:hypothetical protein [Acidimicrobiia bacterium]
MNPLHPVGLHRRLANSGALSDASAASDARATVTPAEVMPRHSFDVIVSTRAICGTG